MIRIQEQSGNLIIARFGGTVTHSDYTDVLVPAVEAVLNAYDRVRLIGVIDEDLEGYEWKAVLDDAVLGIQHWAAWEKIAVVGGPDWIRRGARMLEVLMPGRVETFEQMDSARRWLDAGEVAVP